MKALKKSPLISYIFNATKVCTSCAMHFERVPSLPSKVSTAPLE